MKNKVEFINGFSENYLDTLEEFDDLGVYRFNDIDINWLNSFIEFSESIFEEDAFDASTIISQIFFGAVYVLLDKNKKEIVGIAALNRCWNDDIFMVYLAEYAIAEKVQGLGIGTRFLGRVLYNLKGQGVQKVRLTVAIDNGAGIHLYKKLGFEILKEQKNLYGKGAHRYIMEKELNID